MRSGRTTDFAVETAGYLNLAAAFEYIKEHMAVEIGHLIYQEPGGIVTAGIGQAVWLHGLALMGHHVMLRHQAVKGLERLALVSSSRASPMWEGRCVVLGKMQMTADGIKATAAKLLHLINMPLPSDIAQVERRLAPARIGMAA